MREAVVPQKTFKMCNLCTPISLQGLGGTQTTASVRGQVPELPGGSTFDLLGETHSLRIRQGLGLLVDVPDVQHLTHELNDRLGFVEGSG